MGVTVGLDAYDKINTLYSCPVRYAGFNLNALRLTIKCHTQKLSQGPNIRHKLNSNTDETFSTALNILPLLFQYICTTNLDNDFVYVREFALQCFRVVPMLVAVNWQTVLHYEMYACVHYSSPHHISHG